MFILHGTRFYGKVDHVPGLFHVATLFFHLQFIPFIPLGSYLVLECGKHTGRPPGIKMPWSAKSVLVAWMRLLIVVAGTVSLFPFLLALTILIDNQRVIWHVFLIALAIAGGSSLLLWASYRFTRAKATRALELASKAGIPPEVVAQFFASRLTDDELEQLAYVAQTSEDSTHAYTAPEESKG
jgi:hypothetical protein